MGKGREMMRSKSNELETRSTENPLEAVCNALLQPEARIVRVNANKPLPATGKCNCKGAYGREVALVAAHRGSFVISMFGNKEIAP